MRLFWVLALCAGVCAGQTNTVEGTGTGSGRAKEGTGAGSGVTTIGGWALLPAFDNLYTPMGGSPTWEATDGPAAAPLLGMNSSLASTPASGPVVNVAANDFADLQAKVSAAVCGNIFVLPAGSVYTGNLVLPNVPGCVAANNYIHIKTSGMANLPGESERYVTSAPSNNNVIYAPKFGPCYAGVTSLPGRPPFNCPATPGNYLAKIVTPNIQDAITFAGGAAAYRLMGLEVASTPGLGSQVYELISVGDSSTDATGNANHIVLDRVWCHGTEGSDEVNRCVRDGATNYFAVVDSYFNDFKCIAVHGSCTDSKAIGGGTNTSTHIPEGPIKIVNNFLEAAGENMLHGGGTSNTTPADLEIRGNLFFKPLTWLPIDDSWNGGYGAYGDPPVVKNPIEFKNANRVLMEGNQFINTWGGFTQKGQGLTLTAVNQGGGCPQCVVDNVTFRYNLMSTVNFFGMFSLVNNGGYLAAEGNHYSIHDNVADNIGYGGADGPYSPSSSSLISNTSDTLAAPGQQVHHVTWDHNTFVYAPNATTRSVLGVTGPTIASGANMDDMTFTNNVAASGWGVSNSKGGSDPTNCANSGNVLTQCWSPIVFGNNCFVANGSHTWPGINITSVADYPSVFQSYANGNGGDYTIAPGACKGAASDGRDPGANLALLNSVLQGHPSSAFTPVPATFFGLHWKGTVHPWPSVSFGSLRLWDSGTRWQVMQTGASTYVFTTTLDPILQAAKTNGLTDVLLTLSATPNFISSDPTDTSCDYSSTANGACGVPTDIAASCTNVNGLNNCDGKTDGTNQTWRNFIYNLGTHIAGLSSSTYQKVTAFEIWNEFTQSGGTSWEGTNAQLVRMVQDANCILTGRGVITSQGNAACNAANMGVAAVNVLPGVTITTPDSTMTAPESTSWGTYLTTAGALETDIAAVHAYTQGGTCCALPETVVARYNTALTKLTAAGGTQRIWSTEGGYGQQAASEPDLDLQAAFVARYYLLGWASGFQRLYWYAWDSPSWGTMWNPNGINGCSDGGSGLGCVTKAGVSYGQSYSWMVDSVMTSPCSVLSGTAWSCTLVKSDVTYLVLWDISQSCSSGSCTTVNQTVSPTWGFYQDMTSVSPPTTIVSNAVPVGAKPVILSPK